MNWGDSLCLVFFLGGTGSNVVTGVWLELLLLWWSHIQLAGSGVHRTGLYGTRIPSTCLVLSRVGQDDWVEYFLLLCVGEGVRSRSVPLIMAGMGHVCCYTGLLYVVAIVCIAILPAYRILGTCCLTHICRSHWYRQLVKFDQCYWLPITCSQNISPYWIDGNLANDFILMWRDSSDYICSWTDNGLIWSHLAHISPIFDTR